ncbi:immunoglobulin-like domain-containing protein, partial [Neobacillus drentensis]|uniref:immunoglobulin-like domain-containing protein n=1 Tax=Neobacillus drentensis TaxID=220684 RepID=UPI00300125FF
LTSAITVAGTVDTTKKGVYKLNYTVKDSSGNETVITRKITVIDNINPVIYGAADTTINMTDTFDAMAGVSAEDNEDGDLTS